MDIDENNTEAAKSEASALEENAVNNGNAENMAENTKTQPSAAEPKTETGVAAEKSNESAKLEIAEPKKQSKSFNKKDNSNMWLIIAVICLVVSSAGSIAWKNFTSSKVTNEKVLAVTDPYEFVAAVDGTYEKGILNLKVETNAPNGSIIDVYAQHPEGDQLEKNVVINRGVGEVQFEIPEGLSTNYVTVFAILDMEKQEQDGKQLAVKRYGMYGSQMKGEKLMTKDGQYISGASEINGICYPSEAAVKEILNSQFQEIMTAFPQIYPELFSAIKPMDNGSWEEMTVVLSDKLVETEWPTYGKEQKEQLFSMFAQMPIDYMVLDKETKVKVTFVDNKGTVLGKNF